MHRPAISETDRSVIRVLAALCLVLAALLGFGVPAWAERDTPMVMNAWVRGAPPNVKTHAAYLTIDNRTATAIDFVGVESPQYARAELHLSKVEGGVATMTRQDQITIPAKGRLVMDPGGFHIMLMRPKAPVGVGDIIDITLRFADGATVGVKAPVRKTTPMPQGGQHRGHDMTHPPKTN